MRGENRRESASIPKEWGECRLITVQYLYRYVQNIVQAYIFIIVTKCVNEEKEIMNLIMKTYI